MHPKIPFKKIPENEQVCFRGCEGSLLKSCGLQKMKSVLSGVRSFSKLLLTGLNPHIQKIVSLLFTMILNKRKNLSCVFLLLRGHNFLSVKGCNRQGWVKARSKPLVRSMTKETNFLFFPNRQSACPFVKSVCAFRQSGLQSVCLTSLCLSCLELRSHSSFSFFHLQNRSFDENFDFLSMRIQKNRLFVHL